MKAWQYTGVNEPLRLTDLEEPTAGQGHVVVDIKAAGICHTDVTQLYVGGLTLPKVPITMGHEVAGVISEVGDGVSGWSVGDRVGVVDPEFNSTRHPGYGRDGGFAEKLDAPIEMLVRIPEGVSFVQGAVGTDAGATSYNAMFGNGRVNAGDKVGVIGFGGLGQIGARAAVLKGAEVYVAEINQDVWDVARAAGVKDVATDIVDFAEIGLDVVVDYAGFGTTTAAAIEAVRPGGRVVQVGLGRLESTISTYTLVMKQVQLVGSMGGGSHEAVEGVYELFASGDLDPVLTEISFEEIPDAIERMHHGSVVGRTVASIGD